MRQDGIEDEIAETAPLRESICEQSGHGILSAYSSDVVETLTALPEQYCGCNEAPKARPFGSGASGVMERAADFFR